MSYPSAPGPAPVAQPLAPSDERLWASLAHFGNIIGFLPSLLIFLILGPRSAFVKQQAKEALNFIITAVIAVVALGILSVIFSAIAVAAPSGVSTIFGLLGLLVGLLQFLVWVAVIVFSIIAGLRVTQGGSYRYPFALRLIK